MGDIQILNSNPFISSINPSLHKPNASFPEARRLFHQLKQILINPITKNIFINVEFRKLCSLSLSEIKLCEFFLNSLEYIELIISVENKTNIWTALGELSVNELDKAFISKQFVEKLWIPDAPVILIEQQLAMQMSDLEDIYYQLKYIKRVALLTEEHHISIEVQKAFYIIKRWKSELTIFHNEMKQFLIQMLSVDSNSNSNESSTKNSSSSINKAKNRRNLIQLGQMLRIQYQNLRIDDYTELLDGTASESTAEIKSEIVDSNSVSDTDLECFEDILSENIEYDIPISDWYNEGLNKYLFKIEQQLKEKAQNNIDNLCRNIYSINSPIEISNAKEMLDELENQSTSFQNKQTIIELLDNILHLNQYYYWIKHLESSIQLLDSMMSSSITNNQITITLNGFSKIRSLISRSDDENYLNRWQKIFNRLFEIKSSYSKYYHNSSNDLYKLKRAIFTPFTSQEELEIFNNIDKLATILGKCDTMIIELNFHIKRYINSISTHIPIVPSEISVRNCIALSECSSLNNNSSSSSSEYSANDYGSNSNTIQYFSLVQANLDSEYNTLPLKVDLTVELSLNEAKELILVELIDIAVYIENYNPKWLFVARQRLEYLMEHFIQYKDNEEIVPSIQLKLNTIIDLLKMLQQIQEENQSVLNSLNYELYSIRDLNQNNQTNLQEVLINSQLTMIRLEKVMIEFVKIYMNEKISSESEGLISLPLIKGIKLLMQANNKQEVLDALQFQWISGELTRLRINVIKQEPAESNNDSVINKQIKSETGLISLESKANWKELESRILKDLNYDKLLLDDELAGIIEENIESETDTEDIERLQYSKKRLKRRKRNRINLKNMRKLRRLELESNSNNSLLAYYQKSEPIDDEGVIEHKPIVDLI